MAQSREIAGNPVLVCFPRLMSSFLVLTLLGNDRPGIVNSLADIVSAHGGSWLESRMARLAGQFAGIARIQCPPDAVDALLQALGPNCVPGLAVQVVREDVAEVAPCRTLVVDVVGNDRPGIVREFTAAIAMAGGNVEELTTGLESAPMTGQTMFRAHGVVSVPEETETATLITAIENLGGDLTVDLSI
jgi:glycine cleavage system regulatory protein